MSERDFQWFGIGYLSAIASVGAVMAFVALVLG